MNSTAGFHFTRHTIEFLAADEEYSYELIADRNDDGINDTFRSGSVSNAIRGGGEIESWYQQLFPGSDHRNGWSYGELTITRIVPEPAAFACVIVLLLVHAVSGCREGVLDKAQS